MKTSKTDHSLIKLETTLDAFTSKGLRRTQLSYAVSMALASLMVSNGALAQVDKGAPAAAGEAEVAQVLVVGARASQPVSYTHLTLPTKRIV